MAKLEKERPTKTQQNEQHIFRSEEEKKDAFSFNKNNEKTKSNKKHRRSKSGGILLTKTTAVHWDDGPTEMGKEIEKCSTTHESMGMNNSNRHIYQRAHRRAKSHGAVRQIFHRTTKKFGEEEEMAKTESAAILSPPAIKAQQQQQKNKITVAKRRYSVFRHDSLMWEEMPQFTDRDRRLRKSVPSSPQTIIVLAGLFVCGLILLISGLIVLWTNWSNANAIQNGWYYHVAGCTMLLVGFAEIGICAVLQRKNITKLAEDMSKDLFNVAANAAASEAKRATEEKAMGGGSKKLKRMLAQVPSTMI